MTHKKRVLNTKRNICTRTQRLGCAITMPAAVNAASVQPAPAASLRGLVTPTCQLLLSPLHTRNKLYARWLGSGG